MPRVHNTIFFSDNLFLAGCWSGFMRWVVLYREGQENLPLLSRADGIFPGIVPTTTLMRALAFGFLVNQVYLISVRIFFMSGNSAIVTRARLDEYLFLGNF